MKTVQEIGRELDAVQRRWEHSSSNGDAMVEQAQADVVYLMEHIALLEGVLKKCRHDLTTYDGLWAVDGDYETDEHFRLDTASLVDEIDRLVS